MGEKLDIWVGKVGGVQISGSLVQSQASDAEIIWLRAGRVSPRHSNSKVNLGSPEPLSQIKNLTLESCFGHMV